MRSSLSIRRAHLPWVMTMTLLGATMGLLSLARISDCQTESGYYLFKPLANPLWCMATGFGDSYNGRMGIRHCELSDIKYMIMELVAVGPEVYVIRANTSFIGSPQPPDELRCFTDPQRSGPYVYLAMTCEGSQTQQFKVLEVREGEWVIKNEVTNLCPTFSRVNDVTLAAVCNETDRNQLWMREPY